MNDLSTLNVGPHKDCIVAPDGWCFTHGVWAVAPDAKQALRDAQQWLGCVKSRQDPTTRLIRRLSEALEIRIAYYEDYIARNLA